MAGIDIPTTYITVLSGGRPEYVPCDVASGATVFWGYFVTEAAGDITEAGDEATNVFGITDYDTYLIQNDVDAVKYAVGQTVKVLKHCKVYTKAGAECTGGGVIVSGDFVVISATGANRVQKYVQGTHTPDMIVGKANSAAAANGDILEVDLRGWC